MYDHAKPAFVPESVGDEPLLAWFWPIETVVRFADRGHDLPKMGRELGVFFPDVIPTSIGQPDTPTIDVERGGDDLGHRRSIPVVGSRGNPLFRTCP